jgi:hypothetical protein
MIIHSNICLTSYLNEATCPELWNARISQFKFYNKMEHVLVVALSHSLILRMIDGLGYYGRQRL